MIDMDNDKAFARIKSSRLRIIQGYIFTIPTMLGATRLTPA